ncbi:MAG: DUF2062 domain-containing protein [Phyllobacterium sp.]
MLFRRRTEPGFRQKMHDLVWPRTSLSRSLRYVTKRVLRLTASPHAIAAGVAAGVFASTTPLLGFHTILAMALTWLISGNMIAAVVGTAFGNPIVLPIIWGVTLETGRFILTGSWSGEGAPENLGHMLAHLDFEVLWQPYIKPMLVGSVPVGLALALGFYLVTRWAVHIFRQKRQARLAANVENRQKPDGQAGANL